MFLLTRNSCEPQIMTIIVTYITSTKNDAGQYFLILAMIFAHLYDLGYLTFCALVRVWPKI